MISIDDLRMANAKMIELQYEKEINAALRRHIDNDSTTIFILDSRLRNANRECSETVQKIKRERNVASGISIGAILLLIISLL